MAKFSYQLNIGNYKEPVKVDIDISIEDGLNKEDYEKVRSALKIVEDIALEYKPYKEGVI